MDTRGLYLNRWTPDFDPKMDVPSVVPGWVRLLHVPLHCWGDDSIKAIGNVVGNYIDRCQPKENMHACARICVKVDLARGVPEAIKIKVDEWMHIQQLDYEQIPFKCKVCHEYGHFANRCTTRKMKVKKWRNWKINGNRLRRKKLQTSNQTTVLVALNIHRSPAYLAEWGRQMLWWFLLILDGGLNDDLRSLVDPFSRALVAGGRWGQQRIACCKEVHDFSSPKEVDPQQLEAAEEKQACVSKSCNSS